MAETLNVNGVIYTRTSVGWTWFDDRVSYTYMSAGKATCALDALSRVTDERDALRTQLAAARELLIEAAIDIEAGVNATYHGPSNVHPALYHKYARDLEITARLMIAALITEAPTDAK